MWDVSENLAFSMKSLVGALVLSTGLEGMWCCMYPYFEELLLLSPSEHNMMYGNTSPS